MCQRVQCRRCGLFTFSGCGRHVEQVLGDVPAAQRCPGHPDEGGGASSGFFAWLGALFGRKSA